MGVGVDGGDERDRAVQQLAHRLAKRGRGELHPAELVHDDHVRSGPQGRDREALEVVEHDAVAADAGRPSYGDVREHALAAVERLEREADAPRAVAQLAREQAGHGDALRAQHLHQPGSRGRLARAGPALEQEPRRLAGRARVAARSALAHQHDLRRGAGGGTKMA